MPRIDFNAIDEHGDLAPDGAYVCVIERVRVGQTKSGEDMWHLRLRIIEDEYAGRVVFDTFPFTAAAMPRLKLACRGLGIDTSGPVDLSPSQLQGRQSRVLVAAEDFQDKHGRSRRISKVIYDGYLPLNREEGH